MPLAQKRRAEVAALQASEKSSTINKRPLYKPVVGKKGKKGRSSIRHLIRKKARDLQLRTNKASRDSELARRGAQPAPACGKRENASIVFKNPCLRSRAYQANRYRPPSSKKTPIVVVRRQKPLSEKRCPAGRLIARECPGNIDGKMQNASRMGARPKTPGALTESCAPGDASREGGAADSYPIKPI